MLEIDGSRGGGQIVRSAVALSTLTDTSIRIENVRGDRPEPGLSHQHRTAVDLAADIADADVTGTELGSETVTFDPGSVSGGRYRASIETAGSITLVFDTVLPLVARLDEPLAVTVRGGTDVKWSPPLDYYRRVKLPLLRRYGVQAVVEPGRRGFFPAGGGEATLRLGPSTPVPISATDRGSRRGVRIYSIGSTHLDDADVAARQAVAAAERLPADAVVGERVAAVAAADSPGSAVVVAATYENGMAGTTALGERGTPAETVGRRAAEAIEAFEASGGAVDEYLADQSLLVLALAGGELAIPRVTAHIASSVDLLDAFGVDVELDRDGRKTVVRITDPIEAADH